MGNILAKSYEILSAEKPDAVLILGDTNSALSAISAKRLKIPIFHMEAGNRCWDWNVPEMINRKIVDHIADVNLPYTEHSRRYLLSEGLDGKMIFVTGSPMKELFLKYRSKIDASDVLSRLNLESQNYFLLSSHREENIDNEKNFLSLMNSINALAEKYQLPIIYSTHPRSCKFIERRQFKFLGDITENEISQAVELAIVAQNKTFIEATDYADAVSMKVVKIIQSFTNVVNRTVWLKSIQ